MNQQIFSFINSTTLHKIKTRENCHLKLVNLLNPCCNYRQMLFLNLVQENQLIQSVSGIRDFIK